MKYSKLTFLPALALGFSACAEQPEVVAPHAQLRSGITVLPPVAVVYSNFGPGMAFDADPSHGRTINGFLGPGIGQQAIAQQFTPSADYTFGAAEVALASLSGPSRLRVVLQGHGALVRHLRRVVRFRSMAHRLLHRMPFTSSWTTLELWSRRTC